MLIPLGENPPRVKPDGPVNVGYTADREVIVWVGGEWKRSGWRWVLDALYWLWLSATAAEFAERAERGDPEPRFGAR